MVPTICQSSGFFTCLLLTAALAQSLDAQGLAKIDSERFEHFFSSDNRIENFRRTDLTFPQRKILAPENEWRFKRNVHEQLNDDYEWQEKRHKLDEFLDRTVTTGLLVVKNDEIVFEKYYRGYSAESLCTSMSVAKSFVSALVGTAVADGSIKSIDDAVTDYVGALRGSEFEGVSIKHVLQMMSGMPKDSTDPKTEISELTMTLVRGGSANEFLAKLQSKEPSGQSFNYTNANTQVLAMVLEAVTGQPLAKLLEQRIWKPLGMEYDASWCLDNHGNEIAYGYLNATVRDYAKFGRLYLHKGDWNGTQILPEKWVTDSVTTETELLKLKNFYEPGWDLGYGYQWWVPSGNQGEFTGLGIWGQYVYVNSKQNTIIVKTSVDQFHIKHDLETITVFRSIVDYFANQ